MLDKIIDFADLGPFIDTPVKHYSSGMYARLGFAIAIYVEPDVLLVDEVLAVGDESFQRRCLDAIHRLQARGVAIVLVSHSLNQVLELCDQCLWLDKGSIVAMGETKMVVRRYLTSVDEAMAQQLLDENSRRLLAEQDENADRAVGAGRPRRWGNGPLRIDQVQMVDENEQITWSFQPLTTVQIRIHYHTTQAVTEPIFSLLIHKLDGHYLWGSNTFEQPVLAPLSAGSGVMVVSIAALALTAGRYTLSVAAYTAADSPYWRNPSDAHEQFYEFQVVSDYEIHGDLVMPHQWRDQRLTNPAAPKAHSQPVTTP